MNNDFPCHQPYHSVLELLLLQNCLPATKESIHGVSTCTEYNKNSEVFHIHTPARGIYILCHGQVKLTRKVNDFASHRIVGVGDVIGLESLHNHSGYETSAIATMHSCIAFIPGNIIQQLIKNDSAFRINLLHASCTSGYTVEKHGVESIVYVP